MEKSLPAKNNLFNLLSAVCAVMCAAVCIASCAKSGDALKDGYYTAEFNDYDANGWKGYLTIRISGQKIIHAEYDAVNPSGFLKSWDIDYMRFMNNLFGTYPNAYSRKYAEELIREQDFKDIDCVSGATYSYHAFLMLAEAVLENARLGITEPRLVPVDPELFIKYSLLGDLY